MEVFVMDRQLVCVVELPKALTNRAYWSVYDLDNKKLSWGFSDGIKGEYGSIPCAMRNAKAAARRILRKRKGA
jgi:hypothetical protein